jgi:hypothetical protein
MTLTATDIAAPLASYARRFHAVVGEGHHVASPLGAWLLLALCATPSEGATRQALNATLGCDVADAAALAAELLASPHPLVPAAAAAWLRPGFTTDVVSRWLAGLPPEVEKGPLPSQADLDAWARDHTFGLIESFPLEERYLWLVAATVLATRVSWERPFDLAPASALGPSSPWSARLSQVLRTPDGPGHEQFIAATEAVGDVAVHTAHARGGLLVTSVAAAPGVPAADVLAVAYDLAMARAARGTAISATAAAGPVVGGPVVGGPVVGGTVARRSLYDLPLGEAPLWVITEQRGGAAERAEKCSAVLPAWSAHSTHDMGDPRLGFEAAAHALAPGDPFKAKQAAMARYSREGFEAAAVSALGIAMSVLTPRQGLIRTAELRFGHPYAVVAVTADEPGTDPGSAQRAGPWHGMPVFSAWVAQPEDAAA